MQRVLAAHQRGDEHQQRALGQVEIGDQRVHRLDRNPGRDEDLRKAAARMDDTILRRHGLQRPHAGGAHADHAAAACTGGVDPLRLLGRDLVILAVHVMVGDVLLLDGAERAQAHMQQHRHDLHALGAHALQQLGRKVQAGRRRGGAAVYLGIDRLIAGLVLQLLVDVRRQRHLAQAVEHILKHALILKAHGAPAVLSHRQHLGPQLALAEHEARAGLGLFAGLEDDLPVGEVQPAQQQELNRPAGTLLHAVQACRDDAGLVDDEHVAGIQIVDHIVKDSVLDGACVSVIDQQAAGIARTGRRLRDQLLRQVVVKIGCLHSLPSLSEYVGLPPKPARGHCPRTPSSLRAYLRSLSINDQSSRLICPSPLLCVRVSCGMGIFI